MHLKQIQMFLLILANWMYYYYYLTFNSSLIHTYHSSIKIRESINNIKKRKDLIFSIRKSMNLLSSYIQQVKQSKTNKSLKTRNKNKS